VSDELLYTFYILCKLLDDDTSQRLTTHALVGTLGNTVLVP